MAPEITLLITAPNPALLSEIARRKPGWQVLPLEDRVPAEPLAGDVWAFVDWLCPRISGLELCRRLRGDEITRDAHITMVLDDPQGEARRRAIEAGADDYLPGPLDADRLFDRIGPDKRIGISGGPAVAVASGHAPHHLVLGQLTVDLAAHSVNHAGQFLRLRPNEFKLLAFFLQNPDQVHSRAALVGKLWQDSRDIDERTVDVWVGRLRRALVKQGVPDPLRTVRSLGYVLDSQN